MKLYNTKSVTILLFFFVFTITNLNGQNPFYKKGAEWVYKYDSECGTGYQSMKYTKDTIIMGVNCLTIETRKLFFGFASEEIMETRPIEKYVYYDEGKLYSLAHQNNREDVYLMTFDFHAKVGDTMVIVGYKDRSASSILARIDSIGSQIISKIKLKTWFCSILRKDKEGKILDKFNRKIMFTERIGSSELGFKGAINHLTPLHFKNLTFLGYRDDEGFSYDPHNKIKEFDRYKNDYYGTSKKSSFSAFISNNIEFKLYPNPTSNFLNIKIDKSVNLSDLKIEVFKSSCGIVKLIQLNDYNYKLNLSNYSNGNYYFVFKVNDKVIEVQNIVKVE